MITGITESKILTKHISCECKCKINGRKCNLNQKTKKIVNIGKNAKIWKERNADEKDYFWNPATCSCGNV